MVCGPLGPKYCGVWFESFALLERVLAPVYRHPGRGYTGRAE